jgi:site-specific DNA-methyltransferase (adenine-specific)
MKEDYKTDNLWFMKGDCLERMKEIPDGSVDMILTDPPYGTTACKWDTVLDLDRMWAELERVVSPKGAIVMTASQPFTSALIMSNPKMFKYEWIWEKSKASNFLQAKRQPLKAHENVLVFCKSSTMYYPVMEKGEAYKGEGRSKKGSNWEGVNDVPNPTYRNDNKGTRYPRSVKYFKTAESEKTGALHPTQKPVALMEYMIRTYTNEGETVLDFTAGSFTTGVACVNLDRKFIGIETDDHYYDIGTERVLNTLANKLEEK